MKKSSLKKYITLLEAAADSATHARDYWMREHERRVEELLEADNKIAELERRLIDSGNRNLGVKLTAKASDHWMRQYELKDKELLKAKDEIAELKRRLDDNGGLCTLRAKLIGETCKETNDRLREDNERLLEASPTHQHNHTFERDNNDTQA